MCMNDTAVYIGGIQVYSREASTPQLLLFCCQQKCSTNSKPFYSSGFALVHALGCKNRPDHFKLDIMQGD